MHEVSEMNQQVKVPVTRTSRPEFNLQNTQGKKKPDYSQDLSSDLYTIHTPPHSSFSPLSYMQIDEGVLKITCMSYQQSWFWKNNTWTYYPHTHPVWTLKDFSSKSRLLCLMNYCAFMPSHRNIIHGLNIENGLLILSNNYYSTLVCHWLILLACFLLQTVVLSCWLELQFSKPIKWIMA